MPEFIDSLPDNFTLEYDLLCDNPGKVWGFYTSLVTLSERNRPENWQSSNSRFTFTVAAYPDGNSTSMVERRKDGVGESSMSDRKSTRLNSSHIQKSRMPSSA